MSNLQIFTRGQVAPYGKPMVLLACYGREAASESKEIAEDILKIQDCAVLCFDQDYNWTDEKLQNLKSVPLVLVVTSDLFLMDPFPMIVTSALENHQPMLPVKIGELQQGLYEAYFGNMQYLDKTDHDSTRRAYQEKLEQHLDQWMVGDELKRRIIDAFAATIFLSYRKMDRKIARKLIKQIQSMEIGRDIAIWYDEYLIIGEDFREDIKQAISDSQLFLVAATENVLEKDNFILTDEYPTAYRMGKNRLVVRIGTTDPEKLEDELKPLQRLVDYDDQEKLQTVLLEMLAPHMKTFATSGPEHDYLIGMAYLLGIRTEPQEERALGLIEKAANDGWVEAMAKLAELYEYGFGSSIKQNPQKAIDWHRRIVELARVCYEKENDEQNAEDYLKKMLALGHAYCRAIVVLPDAGEYEAAELELEADAFKLAGEWDQRTRDPKWFELVFQYNRQCALSFFNAGDVLHPRQAEEHAWNCCDALEYDCMHGQSPAEVYFNLYGYYRLLGHIKKYEGEHETLADPRTHYRQAREHYDRAATYLRKSIDAGKQDGVDSLWGCYSDQGDVHLRLGEFDQALECYRKAEQELAIRHTAPGDAWSIVYYNLSRVYMDRAVQAYIDHCVDQNACEQAVDYTQKALKEHENILNDGTIAFLRFRSILYQQLADAYMCFDGPFDEQAVKYYRLLLETALLWGKKRDVSAAETISIALIKIYKVVGDFEATDSALQQIEDVYLFRKVVQHIINALNQMSKKDKIIDDSKTQRFIKKLIQRCRELKLDVADV